MSDIYIDAATRRRIATKWVEISLFALHAWATMLVLAIMAGRESEVIAGMFSTVTFGIGATLVILLFDRAADAVIAKLTGTTTRETVQTTRITEPAPPGGASEAVQPSA